MMLGLASGVSNEDYTNIGAEVCSNSSAYAKGQLILKVKEILPEEFSDLKEEHIILTNIHAAADKKQLDKMLSIGLTAIALENTHQFGSPNCPLAGEIGALEGVRLSLFSHGGTGRHFMGHYGAKASTAVVIGLGQVGRGALRTLLRLGVSVTGLDISPAAMHQAKLDWFDSTLEVDHIDNISKYINDTDMIFNCVMWPKECDNHLISRKMIHHLKPTCVIIDIACDAGGAVETCKATTWDNPIYIEEGITHFCVDNIPAAVPMTASAGNGYANIDKILSIANNGVISAIQNDPFLARGLTCHAGELILEEAAIFQKRSYTPIDDWLAKKLITNPKEEII
ncbi:MAG: NAD(P)-dependent oxidoreductase [Ostreibacterium sp.]